MELNAAEKICQRSKPDNLAARNEAQAAAISRFYQNQRCPEEQPSCEKTAVLLRNLDASTALFTRMRRGASGMGNAACVHGVDHKRKSIEIRNPGNRNPTRNLEMGGGAKSKIKKKTLKK